MAFGDTEILARLSTGGMGEVLLGRRHGALGFEKLCAVKTIRGDLTSRADFRAMFLDEARLVARLDHPSIAQVYDFGEEGSTLYLAMEYVPGVPLSQLLKAGRAPFPPSIAARMIADVLRGLHYAHEVTDVSGQPLGVVHRDVSPQNIILTFEGRMKILDFGIAITKDREAPDTAVGVLKGKPSYMAPEHLRGGAVDRRADVFSASVVINAAGAWGDEVAGIAGVSPLGLRPCRRTAAIVDPAPAIESETEERNVAAALARPPNR